MTECDILDLENVISNGTFEQYDVLMKEHGDNARLLPFFVRRTEFFDLLRLYLGEKVNEYTLLWLDAKVSLDSIALALECGANPNFSEKKCFITGLENQRYDYYLALRLMSPVEDTEKVSALILMLAAAGGTMQGAIRYLFSDQTIFQGLKRLHEIQGKAIKTQAEYEKIWQKACSRDAVQKFCFDRIKKRALQVCIATQDLNLPAWCTVRIILQLGEPFSRSARLHHIWTLVTTVKHFSSTDTLFTHRCMLA